MAAGLSSRFAPISMNIQSPLVKVKGQIFDRKTYYNLKELELMTLQLL